MEKLIKKVDNLTVRISPYYGHMPLITTVISFITQAPGVNVKKLRIFVFGLFCPYFQKKDWIII